MDGEGIQRWETSAVANRSPWLVKKASLARLTLGGKMDRPSYAGSQRCNLAGLGRASKQSLRGAVIQFVPDVGSSKIRGVQDRVARVVIHVS
jgi:hypothetical protein